MSNLLYEIKNLQIKSTPKSGAIKILNNINFNINKGEILGLIGESGSGKSMFGVCSIRNGSSMLFNYERFYSTSF